MSGYRAFGGSLLTEGVAFPKIFTSLLGSYQRKSDSSESSGSPTRNSVTSRSSTSISSAPTSTSIQYKPAPTESGDYNDALIQAYGAESPKTPGYLWCPIFKQYLPPCIIDISRIIPEHTDPNAVGYLFGNGDEGSSHINSLSNGIIMASCIGRLFTQGDFSIIPVQRGGHDLDDCFSGGTTIGAGSQVREELKLEEQASLLEIQDLKDSTNKPGRKEDKYKSVTSRRTDSQSDRNDISGSAASNLQLRIILMKPYLSHMRISEMDLYYSDIHNTVLEFKSSFRPDLRYLYFKYIAFLLIWLNVEEAKLYKDMWRPKERWLRESLVVEIARPERISNWQVYEDVIAGRGMFDEEQEEGQNEGGWPVTVDPEMKKVRLQKMASALMLGVLLPLEKNI
ncbi:hypothetical protein H072_3057 [Dactylellina haptotyla CBS 200.50]|uniref:HNH nuclease domain-containing protein n=1 Tax=Dactylellina haptotyla (strain CBS 200.50) TaxID=1284197 RepID=S8APF1_DACHA|nr:hypothetical protein H072_3057 [Dactylellina haptotyla CBS 200.50]